MSANTPATAKTANTEVIRMAIAQAASLYGAQDAGEKLATLPDLIRKAEERVQKLAAELAVAQGELEVAEAVLMQRIMDETASNGKPKYGSDAARRAALSVLKAGDAECRFAAERVRRLAQELEAAKAERQQLRDKFAAALAKARLAAAQMELAAAIVQVQVQ